MVPPRRILAAVDFSPGSRAAYRLADRLARQGNAELHVLCAVEPALIAAAGAQGVDLRMHVEEDLRRFTAGIATTPLPDTRYHVIEGGASSVILNIAQRECIDLIVLGKEGLGDAAWPGLGATLEDIVHRTTMSVLAVPAGWTPPRPDTDTLAGVGPVIAGVDMTCPSIDAASAACRLAALLGTQAILVHAVPPPQTAGQWAQYAAAAAEQARSASIQDVERATRGIAALAPVAPSLVVEPSDVAGLLSQSARAHPDSIVVLGRGSVPHAYGPPGSLLARTLTLGGVPVLLHVGE